MAELQGELEQALAKFQKGNVVLTKDSKIGVVEWVGILTRGEKSVVSVGVRVLDGKGKCDGVFEGKRLFECGENEGLFVTPKHIKKKISSRKLLEQLHQLQKQVKALKGENANLTAEIDNLKRGDTSATADEAEGDDDVSIKKFLNRELKKEWFISSYDLSARYHTRSPAEVDALYKSVQAEKEKSFDGFKGSDGHSRIVYCVAASPRDNLVASGSDDKTVRLWRRNNRAAKCIAKLQLRSCINAVAIRPDGNQLAAALDNGWVELWDLRTGKNMGALEGATSSEVWTVCYAPDGTMLISGALDRSVRIWDVNARECKWALRGHEEWVNGVTVSNDGHYIVSGSGDKTVRTWETRKMALLNTMKGHTNFVRSVAVVQDKFVCSAADDNTMRIWDIQSATCNKICTEHTKGLYCVSAGSAKADYVATASRDATVKLWNVTNSSTKSVHTFKTHKGDVNSCAFLDGGNWLVSGSDDKSVCFNGPIQEILR